MQDTTPHNQAESIKPQSSGIQEPDSEVLRHRKASYWWNTIAGLLFTAQSVIMLVVITRVCDVYTAGVFTIAFAVGNLFMNMGMYGMRKFQASDRRHEFTFKEYRNSRAITSLCMIVASGAYIAYSSVTLSYPPEKTLVIFVMCLFKVVDVVEDVYSGAYQVQDRLDVGQKMVSLRQAVTLTAFVVVIMITADLGISLIIITVFTSVFFAGQVVYIRKRYGMPAPSPRMEWRKVGSLLKQCFPLFAAMFLLFYIGSAPKYAIDAMMDDAAQAYYGYISMPVFVVNVLATFVYNPMVTELTDLWQVGHVREFLIRFAKVTGAIAALTAICVIGAWLVGVPVLNILYNTDIAGYLVELLVLVAGGGFLALATLANVGITVIRFQRVLVPLYTLMAVVAFLVSNWTVSLWGVTGASWAYFSVMAVTAVVFSAAFLVGCKVMRIPRQ